MMNKIIFLILVAISASMADFYYGFSATETDNEQNSAQPEAACSSDMAELSLQKRNLAKKFEECSDKRTDFSVSILFFTVAKGEYGESEEAKCFKEYSEMLSPLASCIKENHRNVRLFSADERDSYLFYWGSITDDSKAFNELIKYMLHFKQIQEKEAGLEVLDKFNTSDEEYALRNVSLEKMEKKIAEANGSREDKDMLRLYFKYIKSKYNWKFRCSIKPAFMCDTSWLGDEKNAFLKKYPESDYREFVETQMPGFPEKSDEEKKQAKAENEAIKQKVREKDIAEQIAERDVWVALTGIAMFGIPVTSTTGFDDNFDVSTMLGVALRASYRRVFFQYQYNFALGDNNGGGSIAEKSYSLLGGVAIGPKKWLTVDLLFGLSWIDFYPKDEDMARSRLDHESWVFGVQGNYYFPISDSWDITAFAQAKMNYAINFCRNSYLEIERSGSTHCRDPYSSGSTGATNWEDMQWTFSLGVGIRFWKPKPASWY
jgi:hypothetical protein